MAFSLLSLAKYPHVLVLLIAATMQLVDGFASYMLASGGCYIELDTEEVIMNHRVQAVDENAPLHVIVASPSEGISLQTLSDDHEMVVIDGTVHSFPLEIELQVIPVPPSSSPRPSPQAGYNYEYVLQLDEASSTAFEYGACDGDKRISNQSYTSKNKFTWESADEQPTVAAAWASGHEAVKLLKGLKFVTKSNLEAQKADQEL